MKQEPARRSQFENKQHLMATVDALAILQANPPETMVIV